MDRDPNTFSGYAPTQAPSPMDERAQLQQAYRQFLGREASPDELQNWLSGAFGYGQSGNLRPIFEAIRQSSEAQQQGSRPPGGPYPGDPGPIDFPLPENPGPFKPRPPGPFMPIPGGGMPMPPMPGEGGFPPTSGTMPIPPPPMMREGRPGRPSARPLGSMQRERMRKAILGVPQE